MSRAGLIRGFRDWVARHRNDGGDFAAAAAALGTPAGAAALDEVVDRWIDAQEHETSAGVAIYRKPSGRDDVASVLLVHPTGAGYTGTYSAPKGHVEEDEAEIDAAVREVAEETGVRIPVETLRRSGDPVRIELSGKRRIVVWLVDDDLLKGKRLKPVLPVEQLQLEEVDWAGFVPLNEAATKIEADQLPVLEGIAQRTRGVGAPAAPRVAFRVGDNVKVRVDAALLLPGALDGDAWTQRGVPWPAPQGSMLRVVHVLPHERVVVRRAGERHPALYAADEDDLVKATKRDEVPGTPLHSARPQSEQRPRSEAPSQQGVQGFPSLYDAARWPARAGAALEKIRHAVEITLRSFGFSRATGGLAQVDHDVVSMDFTSSKGDITVTIKPHRGGLGVRASIASGEQTMGESRARPLDLDRVNVEALLPDAWIERAIGFAAMHGNVERLPVGADDGPEALAAEYQRLYYGLPRTRDELHAFRQRILAMPADQLDQLRGAVGPNHALQRLLREAVEQTRGALRWVRKDNLRREDGSEKNVTIGTRVVVLNEQRQIPRTSQGPVARGLRGVVEAATSGNSVAQRQAKEAIGTTAAVRVRFDPSR